MWIKTCVRISFQDYLRNVELDTETGCTLFQYFNFLRLKSSGELTTNAKFIRQFVLNHPDYKKDSIVSEQINYDLFCQIDKIVSGEIALAEALKRVWRFPENGSAFLKINCNFNR